MVYIQNSFFSTIIICILFQERVKLLKYYSIEFTKKHILCLPDRLDDLRGSSGLFKTEPESSIGSKKIEYHCLTFNIAEDEFSANHFSRKTHPE